MASIVASSGPGFAATAFDLRNAVWTIGTSLGPGDTITWTCGTNIADAARFARATASEMKFYNQTPGGPVGPLPRTFTGLSRTDSGPLGSIATISGTGRRRRQTLLAIPVSIMGSMGVPGLPGGSVAIFYWEASWVLSAMGIAVPGGSYYARADGTDPMPLTRARLIEQGIAGDRFHLYLPVALEQFDHSSSGTVGFEVSYETGQGQ